MVYSTSHTIMIHIAYVDHNPQSRIQFQDATKQLQERGIDTELKLYKSATEALNDIPLERPDVVLLDVRISDGAHCSGVDVIRTLRQHPLCRTMIIIAAAENATSAERSAALVAGCQTFVSKPIPYQTLEDIAIKLGFQPAQ
ncbi:MAG: response regulator [Anaerolineae bacterium]|nr:response regulator [Anaerolineae bacterium]